MLTDSRDRHVALKGLLDDFVWRGQRLGSSRRMVVVVWLSSPYRREFELVASSGDEDFQPLRAITGSLATKALEADRPFVADLTYVTAAGGGCLVVPLVGDRNTRFGGRDELTPTERPRHVGALIVHDRRPSENANDDIGIAQLLSALVTYHQARLRGFPYYDVMTRLAVGLSAIRASLGLSIGVLSLRSSVAAGRLQELEAASSSPRWSEVLAWCTALGVVASSDRPLVQLIDVFTPQVLELLRASPHEMARLSPHAFELLVADRFDRMGYSVTVTGATNRKDGGIDIIATQRDPALGHFLVAVQVKHRRAKGPVRNDVIDRVLSLKNREFRFGVVVTNTTFTDDARWIAMQGDNRWFVRLRDFEDVKSWLEEKFSGDRDYASLPSQIEIARGVTVTLPKPDWSTLSTGR
jgi:hypothetical protein